MYINFLKILRKFIILRHILIRYPRPSMISSWSLLLLFSAFIEAMFIFFNHFHVFQFLFSAKSYVLTWVFSSLVINRFENIFSCSLPGITSFLFLRFCHQNILSLSFLHRSVRKFTSVFVVDVLDSSEIFDAFTLFFRRNTMEIVYVYQRKRKDFGRQCLFADRPAEIIADIQPGLTSNNLPISWMELALHYQGFFYLSQPCTFFSHFLILTMQMRSCGTSMLPATP